MAVYVSGNGTVGAVDLSQFDTGSGVLYAAGSGDQTINQDGNTCSINLGSGNDYVHLSNADATVTFGTGTSQIQCGGGHDTFVFSANTITQPGAALDNIIDFDGAGNASGADPSKDFLWFKGFSAGSTLQFRADMTPGNDQVQSYNVVSAAGQIEGTFAVSMTRDADGSFHHLSATTDYNFSNPTTVPVSA